MKWVLKFCIFFCFIFLNSCATPKSNSSISEAEALYNEAKELVSANRFILATEKLNTLRSKYPYSFYSTHAELLAADILFLQENYIEAAAAYILFRDLHPKHEKLPYVIWKIAESYFNQLPSTFDRDITPGDEAIKYYEETLSKYSNSEYSKDSQGKIDKIKTMKRNRDLYIADFYFKTKVFDSARFRYNYLLGIYQDSSIKELAMLRVVLSSFHLKEFEKCIEDAERFLEEGSENFKAELESLKSKCASGKA